MPFQRLLAIFSLFFMLFVSPLTFANAPWQSLLTETPELAFGFGYQQALKNPSAEKFLALADEKAFADSLRYQAYAQALGQLLKNPDYNALIEFASRDVLPVDIRLVAVANAYALAQKTDTVAAYLDFMAHFPNSAEAGLALLRVHELTYAKVLETNTVEKYDAFIDMFPGAKQIPDAKERAYNLEKAALVSTLDSAGFDLKNETSMALLVAAFEAEEAEKYTIAIRKYQLLEELPPLQNTFGRLQYRKDQRDEARFQTLKKALLAQEEKIETLNQSIAEQFESQQQLIEAGFVGVNQRLDNVDKAVETGFENVNKRFDNVDENLANQEQLMRSGFDGVNQRIDNVDENLANQEQLMRSGFDGVNQRLDNVDANLANQNQLIRSGFAGVTQHLTNIQSNVNDVQVQNAAILAYQTEIQAQNTQIQSRLQRQNWSNVSSGLGLVATGLATAFPVTAPFAPLIGSAVNLGSNLIANLFF